jgi:hypothetical protein
MKSGTYNQGEYKQKTDLNGNKYVIVYETDPDTGAPKSRVCLESEVKPGDNYEPYME